MVASFKTNRVPWLLVAAVTVTSAVPNGLRVNSMYNTLQCWQCAVRKGAILNSSSRCPRDSVLFQLPGWDACMTWRLNNGTTLLQNFVMKAEDCTPDRILYWSNYIKRTWGADGWAECCYQDECNHEGRGQAAPPRAQQNENLIRLMNCAKCNAIPHARCNMRMSKALEKSVRIDFDAMVLDIERITGGDQRGVCSCADGFLPIKSAVTGWITKCHDPIVLSSVVGSRCLIEAHCAALPHTRCKADSSLQASAMEDTYMTCQCDDGFALDEQSGQCVLGGQGKPIPCSNGRDCLHVKDAQCFGGFANTGNGECRCKPGFLPLLDQDTLELRHCRDPIVVTSTVNGLCLHHEHCRFLPNTTCQSVPGIGATTCQCVSGTVEDVRNPTTSLIPGCIDPTAARGGAHLNYIPPNEATEFATEFNDAEAIGFTEDDEDAVVTENGAPLNKPSLLVESASVVVSGNSSPLPLDSRGLSSCKKEMTIVERGEWIPAGRFPLELDGLTGACLAVIYAKLPLTAADTDGILIRLLDGSRLDGSAMYTITAVKNREVAISRSFRDSNGEETDKQQMGAISNSRRWLEWERYTGFWIVYNSGYVAMGVVDEHSVDEPLAAWQDPSPGEASANIDTLGLSGQGSAVFYRYDCPLASASDAPLGICRSSSDCWHLVNTECRPSTFAGIERPLLQACQCLPGNQVIPRLSRSSFSGGCYDPIVLTPTLHGRCLDQGHCRKLSNTVCSAGRCECVIGFVPMDTNPRTGLIPGCRESSSSEGPQRFQEVGVEHCLKRFILGVQKSWIPDTLIRTHHNDDRSVFSAKIYVMLNSEDTVVSIKLIDGEKSPDKLYQVTITGSREVAIMENLRQKTILGETRNKVLLKASGSLDDSRPMEEFSGVWITYEPHMGRLAVGEVEVPPPSSPVLEWTDMKSNRLSETPFMGIEVEQGVPAHIGAVCS